MRAARIASWLITTSLVAALGGCGGGSSNSPDDTAEDGDDDEGEGEGEGEPSKRHKEMERPVSDQGKSWGGWRWKGKREDCFYVHGNQCFAKLSAACKAAGCKKSECAHDDSAPAKVSCE